MLPPISSSAKARSLWWMSTPLARAITGSASAARSPPVGTARHATMASAPSARETSGVEEIMDDGPFRRRETNATPAGPVRGRNVAGQYRGPVSRAKSCAKVTGKVAGQVSGHARRGFWARTLAESPSLGNGRVSRRRDNRVNGRLALTTNPPPLISRSKSGHARLATARITPHFPPVGPERRSRGRFKSTIRKVGTGFRTRSCSIK